MSFMNVHVQTRDLNQNLIFLFGPVPKPEFGLSLIIRITWIVRFLLHVFTVGSCDHSVLFVKQFEVYFGTVPERREL